MDVCLCASLPNGQLPITTKEEISGWEKLYMVATILVFIMHLSALTHYCVHHTKNVLGTIRVVWGVLCAPFVSLRRSWSRRGRQEGEEAGNEAGDSVLLKELPSTDVPLPTCPSLPSAASGDDNGNDDDDDDNDRNVGPKALTIEMELDRMIGECRKSPHSGYFRANLI